MMRRSKSLLAAALLTLCALLSACAATPAPAPVALDNIPPFSGAPYAAINDNQPLFTDDDLTTKAFETYGELDALNRCGVAYANICAELMPTEARQGIGQVKPSGWQTVKYDFVDGKYLYNRCHLIGFQLAGENANEKNLITGTRYMNVVGMLPFENLVADYVKETGNHVLYRVTPVFAGENLVASGVLLEARSVEDGGEGVTFHVYCYNVQPGVTIDYATGDSSLAAPEDDAPRHSYILNTGTRKFHLPSCPSVADIKEAKRQAYTGTREAIVAQGYTPCGRCKP